MRPLKESTPSITFVGPTLMVALSVLFCFVPGITGLNYHASLALGLIGSLIAGPLGLSAALRHPTPRAALRASFRSGLIAALIPTLILGTYGLLTRPCDYWVGFGFFLLGATFSLLWASLLGGILAIAFPTRRRAFMAFALLFLLWISWDLLHILRHPAVFAFNPFVGYFAGPLYESIIEADSRLYAYRLYNLVQLATLYALARLWRQRPHPPTQAWPRAIFWLCLTGAFWVSRGHIGFEIDRAQVRATLGAEINHPRLRLIYDRRLPPSQAQALLDAHLFRLDQLEAALDLTYPGQLTSFVYRDADQKKRLMGTSHVYIAKPWLGEIHLNAIPPEANILTHELAHAVLGAVAPPPFHTPTQGPFIPHMALIEGAAVALEGPRAQLGLHAWARAMNEAKRAPSLHQILGPTGFLNQGSQTAYTLAGSFIRWIIDTHGLATFKALYTHGDFARATGQPLSKLIADWERFIAAYPIPADAIALATQRFSSRAIQFQPCGLDIARSQRDAYQRLRQGELDPALALFQKISSWVPEDASKLLPIMEIFFRQNQWDALHEAHRRYHALEHHRTPINDAKADLLKADALSKAALQQAEASPTQAETDRRDALALYTDLAARPQDEDATRNALVRRDLAQANDHLLLDYLLNGHRDALHARCQEAIQSLDPTPPDLNAPDPSAPADTPSPPCDASHAQALAESPHWLTAYLIGRRAYVERDHATAARWLLPLADTLLGAPPTQDARRTRTMVGRESLRLVAHSAFAQGHFAEAAAHFRRLAPLTLYEGDQLKALDWADWADWRKSAAP